VALTVKGESFSQPWIRRPSSPAKRSAPESSRREAAGSFGTVPRTNYVPEYSEQGIKGQVRVRADKGTGGQVRVRPRIYDEIKEVFFSACKAVSIDKSMREKLWRSFFFIRPPPDPGGVVDRTTTTTSAANAKRVTGSLTQVLRPSGLFLSFFVCRLGMQE
jgi:hypothetical protein